MSARLIPVDPFDLVVGMIKRHLKKSQENPNGAIVEREGSIHVSNLQLKTRFEASKKRPAKAA